MHKVVSWKIIGLFQNFRYFSKFTVAVRTGTIVIIPVRYLSLRTLVEKDMNFWYGMMGGPPFRPKRSLWFTVVSQIPL